MLNKILVLFLFISCNSNELENRVKFLERKVRKLEYLEKAKFNGDLVFKESGSIVLLKKESCNTNADRKQCLDCCTFTFIDIAESKVEVFSVESSKNGDYKQCLDSCGE